MCTYTIYIYLIAYKSFSKTMSCSSLVSCRNKSWELQNPWEQKNMLPYKMYRIVVLVRNHS